MTTSDVFTFDDYKVFLTAVIEARGRGMITELANAAGCQRSYLSAVLHSEVHLTPDHCFGISRFLKLDAIERDFLFSLLEKERAASSDYRDHIKSRIFKIRRDRENIAKRLDRPTLSTEGQTVEYFSRWFTVAIHMLTAIPDFQTSQSIGRRLQISEDLVAKTLEQLNEMGLVESDGKRWKYRSGDIHLPRESPLVFLHHNHWRQRAVLRAESDPEQCIHYTMVQAMSKKAFDQIKADLLRAIESSSEIAGPSESEELVCFCTDFFSV